MRLQCGFSAKIDTKQCNQRKYTYKKYESYEEMNAEGHKKLNNDGDNKSTIMMSK